MKADRQLVLKIAAAGAVALFVLDQFVIEPAWRSWGDQSKRITTLRSEVADGQKLLDREKTLRGHWAGMMQENLPADNSAAENAAFKAVARWQLRAGVQFTNLSRQWKHYDEDIPGGETAAKGYDKLILTIAINGSQASIGRFIYEMESDSIPVNLEKCNLISRDPRGSELAFTATFSFLRLPQPEKITQ
jgi:hypothetical protein